MPEITVITTFFNPAQYKSRVRNHEIYVKNMKERLVVAETAFGDDPFQIDADFRFRADSVLWCKERMINTVLPHVDTEYIAWIDGDVLLPPEWAEMAVKKFEDGYDVIQLFENVVHLPPGTHSPAMTEKSLCWQAHAYPDFISLRKKCKILYATTGFAWAGRKSLFEECGFYDKHVLGANDNVVIDCCLDTFELHHYYRAGQGTKLLNDMMTWAGKFGKPRAGYLPITIHHLYHGAKKDRGYLTREDTVRKYDYDPNNDIILKGNVYEWNSDKPEFHEAVKSYFSSRNEDNET